MEPHKRQNPPVGTTSLMNISPLGLAADSYTHATNITVST